jgi:hypothetical protein
MLRILCRYTGAGDGAGDLRKIVFSLNRVLRTHPGGAVYQSNSADT